MKTFTLPQTLPIAETFGDDFGLRDGPCTIEYRNFTWNHHPTYIAHSCLGCAHLVVDEYQQQFCAHPTYLQAYGCRQYLGADFQHRDKIKCHSLSCPALKLRGENEWPAQPQPMPINRGPEYKSRNNPFDEIPVHKNTAFMFAQQHPLPTTGEGRVRGPETLQSAISIPHS